MGNTQLTVDTEEQRDVLEIALTKFIETHVEAYDYSSEDNPAVVQEIREDRQADVMEAEILLHRLDHIDL